MKCCLSYNKHVFRKLHCGWKNKLLIYQTVCIVNLNIFTENGLFRFFRKYIFTIRYVLKNSFQSKNIYTEEQRTPDHTTYAEKQIGYYFRLLGTKQVRIFLRQNRFKTIQNFQNYVIHATRHPKCLPLL
jgi:hypothetical protein